MNATIRKLLLGASLAGSLAMFLHIDSQAREPIPAPPNGGPGETAYPADNFAPRGDGIPRPLPAETRLLSAPDKAWDLDQIGGDDVLVKDGGEKEGVSFDIADNGDIYVAVNDPWTPAFNSIEVFRSNDGGLTWALWGTIGGVSNSRYYRGPVLEVVEGAVSRVLVMFSYATDLAGPFEIHLAAAPLGGSSGAFDPDVVVMSDPGISFHRPRFDTDVESYAGFYTYVVAEGIDGLGDDIWFARSINQGTSFESPYMLASLGFADREYGWPDIAYGYGHRLHVVWHFRSVDDSFDASVRYRRADNFANGGIGSWDNWVQLSTTSDESHDLYPRVQAGRASTDVVVIHKTTDSGSGFPQSYWPNVHVSDDQGATFAAPVIIGRSVQVCGDLAESPDGSTWYFAGCHFDQPYLFQADASDLFDWTNHNGAWNDDREAAMPWVGPELAFDPTRGDRIAVTWELRDWIDPDTVGYAMFDAEWLADPGMPNIEQGFPIGLWAPPLSPPALVDVDGDSDLEIVFTDELNQIQVLHHDGTSVAGWPVDPGVALSDGPVAVGDLNGDGVPTLVVGSSDGRAYAYDPAGQLLTGWPTAISPPGHDCYVAIGALGPPYPRTVVCAANKYVTFRSYHGVAPPGTVGWTISSGTQEFEAPPAIGDVDGDGISEVVAAAGDRVVIIEHTAHALDAAFTMTSPVSDAITLGDLDLNGDLEIVLPCEDGQLRVYEHTTDKHPGFPYDTGISAPLTSAALAQMEGSSQPELAFANRNWTVYLVGPDGVLDPAFPETTTGGWWIWDAPVIGAVEGSLGDIVIGSRDKLLYAWNNNGYLMPGWPEPMGGFLEVSPAAADIDLDGAVEVVAISSTQLFVIDVNNADRPAALTWPMYGHDPQRTGCSDCPEDIVTGVDPGVDPGGPSGITRVSFAPPSPNPVVERTEFRFAIPVRAAVSLDVYDVRGRRVYTVFREETEPGQKIVDWRGRDGRGEPLPRGQYLARLRVRGPGIDESQTRKITVLR